MESLSGLLTTSSTSKRAGMPSSSSATLKAKLQLPTQSLGSSLAKSMRSGLYRWMSAQKALPSLQDRVMLVTRTPG